MSKVALYDPDSTVVANRVTNYILRANTPDYTSNPNALINPDVSGLIGVPWKYWMYDGTSALVEMDASDKTSVDDFLNAKTVRDKNYQVFVYDSLNRKETETWYATESDGTYSNKVEETAYNYDTATNNLLSKTITNYYYDGSVDSTETISYYRDGQKIIEKKS